MMLMIVERSTILSVLSSMERAEGCSLRAQRIFPCICSVQPRCRTAYVDGQVGSKNAAFYLGKCIKMSTKQAGGRFVHELSISAAELEKRYKQGEVKLHPPVL